MTTVSNASPNPDERASAPDSPLPSVSLSSMQDYYEAILKDPESDPLRLQFADFLDREGRSKQAAFIREQVQLYSMPDGPDKEILQKKCDRIAAKNLRHFTVGIEDARSLGIGVTVTRGLPCDISMPSNLISDLTETLLESLLNQPGVVGLELTTPPTREQLSYILSISPRVVDLTFSVAGTENGRLGEVLDGSIQRIKSIGFANAGKLTSADIRSLRFFAPNVRDLKFFGCNFERGAIVGGSEFLFENLESVMLFNTKISSAADFACIPALAPNLRAFGGFGCHIAPESLGDKDDSLSFPALKEVGFLDAKGIDAEFLEVLIEKARNLQHLSLQSCRLPRGIFVEMVGSMTLPSVTRLNLEFNERLSRADKIALKNIFPNATVVLE